MSDVLRIVVSELDGFMALPSDMTAGGVVMIVGLEVDRPAPGMTNQRMYWARDTKRLFLDRGTMWEMIGTLQHDDLSDLGVDVHMQYVLTSGARAMIGHLTLPDENPTSSLHAAPKGYVDQVVASQRSRFQLGIGFKAGSIATADVFADVPISSILGGGEIRGWVITAKVAGAGTTTIQLQRNGAQVSTASLGGGVKYVDTVLVSPLVVNSGDVISAVVTAAGGHQHVGIFVYGTVRLYG